MTQSINTFPAVAWSGIYGYYHGITDNYFGKTEQGWKFQLSLTKNTGYSDKLKRIGKDYSFASVLLTSPSGRMFSRSYYFKGTEDKDLMAVANGFFSEYTLWPLGVYNSEVSRGKIIEGIS